MESDESDNEERLPDVMRVTTDRDRVERDERDHADGLPDQMRVTTDHDRSGKGREG